MNRQVLVTGGSQGIGLAIAQGLAQADHRVTILSRRPPPAAAALRHLPCDLRSPQAVSDAMASWLDSVGGEVDVLVHSAVAYGASARHPLLQCTVDEWDAALDVNARGLMLVLREVLPSMIAHRNGTVLAISSHIATAPGPGRIPYAASKAAAHAIITGLAAELVDSGVSVLEMAPTMQVDTPGIRSRRPPDFEPVGYADPRIFVAPTLWLVNGAARLHHGTCLWIDADGRCRNAAGDLLT